MTEPSREDCLTRDAADPLAHHRAQFDLPDGTIYLDGNSLGVLPKSVPERIERVIRQEWGRDLIRSWNTADWYTLPARVGGKIARLIGARAHEVVAADSTSVNLFKLLTAAVRLRPGRRVILSESGNFPTDLYVSQGVSGLFDGIELRTADKADIAGAIDDDVAVVSLTHVDFRSGQMHDMATVTEAAHEAGALMLWDLAHSAGALPVDLNGCGADLAVGCGYKYLNGGPGAPAFLYVAEALQAAIDQPLSGWMGHSDPFAFVTDYAPADGIRRNLCGTPPVLAMAALDAALDVWDRVDLQALRDKSVAMCDVFIQLVERRCDGLGLTLASPRDSEMRGSQVSFRHAEGYAVMQALIDRGVIGDFRSPDLLRFGFTPLYLRYVDVWDAVDILTDILSTGSWNQDAYKRRAAVT